MQNLGTEALSSTACPTLLQDVHMDPSTISRVTGVTTRMHIEWDFIITQCPAVQTHRMITVTLLWMRRGLKIITIIKWHFLIHCVNYKIVGSTQGGEGRTQKEREYRHLHPQPFQR